MDILHFGDEVVGSGRAEGSGGFCSWEYGGVVAVVDFKGLLPVEECVRLL